MALSDPGGVCRVGFGLGYIHSANITIKMHNCIHFIKKHFKAELLLKMLNFPQRRKQIPSSNSGSRRLTYRCTAVSSDRHRGLMLVVLDDLYQLATVV